MTKRDRKNVKINSLRTMHLVEHRGRTGGEGVPLSYRQSPGVDYMEDIASDTGFLMSIRSWLHDNRKSKRARGGGRARSGRTSASGFSSSSAVASFLVSLGNTPVLTAKQEKRLALIIARGKVVREAAKALARETRQRPPLQAVAGRRWARFRARRGEGGDAGRGCAGAHDRVQLAHGHLHC